MTPENVKQVYVLMEFIPGQPIRARAVYFSREKAETACDVAWEQVGDYTAAFWIEDTVLVDP